MVLEHDPDTGGRLHMDKFTAVDVLDDDINVVGGGGEVKSDVTITVVVDVTTGDDVDEDNIIFRQKS